MRVVGDCIDWDGRIKSTGYGVVRLGDPGSRRDVFAHRWIYEQVHGPIPDGLEIDHLCFNKRCVNVDHLEAVTHRENIRRAFARITHCPYGHEYTPENTIRRGGAPDGARQCRTCVQARDRARYRARRARAA